MIRAYIIVVAVMSVLTAAAFLIDKLISAGGGRRIPEIALLSLIAFGGAAGGVVGMYVFRHKSNAIMKFHFALTLLASLAAQIFLAVFIAGRS